MQCTTSEELLNLQFNEAALPEFPELLFGTTHSGDKYFNATKYLQSQKSDKRSIADFCNRMSPFIQSTSEIFELSKDKIIFYNQHGEAVMDGSLCYLFLMYATPQIYLWFMERINEIMTTGISMSDNDLLSMVVKRYPLDFLQKCYKNGICQNKE